ERRQSPGNQAARTGRKSSGHPGSCQRESEAHLAGPAEEIASPDSHRNLCSIRHERFLPTTSAQLPVVRHSDRPDGVRRGAQPLYASALPLGEPFYSLENQGQLDFFRVRQICKPQPVATGSKLGSSRPCSEPPRVRLAT